MLTLIVLCGAPGSGKTTLSKQLAEQYKAVHISFDERKYIQYAEMISPIVETLTEGKSVVADAVFAGINKRAMVLDAVKDIPCRKILFYMDTPLEECLRRNASREKRLPDFVVEHLYNSIEPPTLEEGWDEIVAI